MKNDVTTKAQKTQDENQKNRKAKNAEDVVQTDDLRCCRERVEWSDLKIVKTT